LYQLATLLHQHAQARLGERYGLTIPLYSAWKRLHALPAPKVEGTNSYFLVNNLSHNFTPVYDE